MTAKDVTALVTDVTPYLSAAVSVYGHAVLSKTRDKAADATVEVGVSVLQRVFGRKKGRVFGRKKDDPLPEPLADVVAHPDDEEFLAVLKMVIRKALERDAGMLADVRSILAAAPRTAINQQIHAEGNAYTSVGDMTIKQYARKPAKAAVEIVDIAVPWAEEISGLPRGAAARRVRRIAERGQSSRQRPTRPGMAAAVKPTLTPSLDVKVRNTGEQSAVLKRLTIEIDRAIGFSFPYLTPYDDFLLGATLCITGDYDVEIPSPSQFHGEPVDVNISQEVEPSRADRFIVRLGMDATGTGGFAYLLRTKIHYNRDSEASWAPVAVGFPRRPDIISPEKVRKDIKEFWNKVTIIRGAIDRELESWGLSGIDWENSPPRGRQDLPECINTLDGNSDFPGRNGIYRVNERFWDPLQAAEDYISEIQNKYEEIINMISSAGAVNESLLSSSVAIAATLKTLPFIDRGDGPRNQFPDGKNSTTITGMKAIPQLLTGDPEDPQSWPEYQGAAREVYAMVGKGWHAAFEDESVRAAILRFLRYSIVAEKYQLGVNVGRLIFDSWSAALGKRHPDTLLSAVRLGASLGGARKYQDAIDIFRSTISECVTVFGQDDSEVLRASGNLGSCLGGLGEYGEAVKILEDVANRSANVLGKENIDTVRWEGNLAVALLNQEDYDRALTVFVRVLEKAAKLGDECPAPVIPARQLRAKFEHLGREQEANTVKQALLKLRRVR